MVLHKKKSLTSPLRYPGGKTRGVREIIKFLPTGINKICSPFLGGGSLELELASRGIEVYGYDIFKPLVDFWQVLLTNPIGLAELVRQYHPLTPRKFYSLQHEFSQIKSKMKRAAVFFALNRASFSGTTLSGGLSPGHPRFTKLSIEHLKEFRLNNFHVECLGFKDSILKHQNDFLYLDPPYLIKSKLYGKNGSAHNNFDHEGLAAMLKKRENWILSYNDCPKVRELYKGYKILKPKWSYGMGRYKQSNELLILNTGKELKTD